MTVSEILQEMEPYTGRFPKKAMRAAIEQRGAITPELLKVLETFAEDPVGFAQREDYVLHRCPASIRGRLDRSRLRLLGWN